MKISGKATRILLNGLDISSYFTAADVAVTVDNVEQSGFGDEDKSYLVGERSASYRLTGHYDRSDADDSVSKLLDSIAGADVTTPIISIVRQRALGAKGNSGQVILKDRSATAPIAGIVGMNASFDSAGDHFGQTRTVFEWGTLLPSVAGGTSEAYNGGTATALGATGYLQMGSVLGGTPVVKIDHSADGATAWTTFITFTGVETADAPEAQVGVTADNLTIQPYRRVVVTGGSCICWVGVSAPIA